MLIATGSLQTRRKHSSETTLQGGGGVRERVSNKCSKLSHYFWPGLSENVFRVKRISNSTIKENMFHMFTYECETVFCTCFGSIDCSIFSLVGRSARCKKTTFNHILFSFVTCVMSSKKKIVGLFAYSEVY